MKLLRRRPAPSEPAATADEPPADVVTGKGRPTPKRRDTAPQRGPVTAPKSRKEAYQWQKQQNRRNARSAGTKPLTNQQFREALRRGDPAALPRRDQGAVRKIARDWVDSHRMVSNYMLVLFPLMVVGYFIPYLQYAVIAVLITIVSEWYLTGRRIRALAVSRLDDVRDGTWSIAFYAGSRAYMPRRWRMPGPQVGLGEEI